MKTRFTLFSIALFLSVSVNAQRYDWASFCEVASGYPNGSSGAYSVARDNQGNFIIVGDYTEDFFSGSDTIHAIALGNGTDVFVAKYSALGSPIWITGFGGNWYDNGYAVATDDAGNIFVGAYIQTPNTTFPDTVISNLTSSQVVKLDANGNYQWSKFIDGPQKCTVAAVGHFIYYTHNYNSIAKLDEAGNTVWDIVPSVGSGGAYLDDLIAAPNGDLIASGKVLGVNTVTYGTFSVTVAASIDVYGYYIRIDTTGIPVAMQQFGPSTTSYYTKAPVGADANGNVYLACQFTGQFIFGATTFDIGSNVYGAVLKFDNTSTPVWADTIPCMQASVEALYFNVTSNSLYVGGNSDNGLYYSNGVNIPDNFNGDGYFVEFSATDGTPLLADSWGQPGSTDVVRDFTGDANGFLYGTGWDYGGYPTLHCKTYDKKSGAILFAFSHASDAININITNSNDSLFANPPATNYQWLLNGDTIVGATNSNLLMTANGTYTIIATNQFGCSAIDSFTINNLGINNSGISENYFSVYPNPVSSKLIIDNGQLTINEIQITDVLGRVIQTSSSRLPTYSSFDVSNFAEGIYYVKLVSSDGVTVVKKIVVNH